MSRGTQRRQRGGKDVIDFGCVIRIGAEELRQLTVIVDIANVHSPPPL
jgi:hypothetical protein